MRLSNTDLYARTTFPPNYPELCPYLRELDQAERLVQETEEKKILALMPKVRKSRADKGMVASVIAGATVGSIGGPAGTVAGAFVGTMVGLKGRLSYMRNKTAGRNSAYEGLEIEPDRYMRLSRKINAVRERIKVVQAGTTESNELLQVADFFSWRLNKYIADSAAERSKYPANENPGADELYGE